ncbi:MAG TPA: UvrD-helicase domain-containing protein [Acidimicrobiales bacterium]|nr:UvrD-helicase domain-containing protein [Acidimicrobiales bacterium]
MSEQRLFAPEPPPAFADGAPIAEEPLDDADLDDASYGEFEGDDEGDHEGLAPSPLGTLPPPHVPKLGGLDLDAPLLEAFDFDEEDEDPHWEDELLADLNPRQREAVITEHGPLVVVAGAGSGKTRVLTRRIAWLVHRGVPPGQILAITFTNKAADEMRRRVVELVGDRARQMWVSTFHSACVRILRREAEHTRYRSGFSIYDDNDSRRLVEHCLEARGVDTKRFPPRAVLGAISQAKAEMLDAADYSARAYTIYEQRIAEVFAEYERRLVAANAMDFDDLLSETVRLFRRDHEVLARYQERFVQVLVDEYQDTNRAQNEIVAALAARHRNVCVVGDSDQSIYRFRGAEIRNLLDFEHDFPDAKTVVLDQNYRSTQTILDAANAVIGNNLVREEKRLWSALGPGEPIVRYRAGDERDEATFVANEIASLRREEGIPAEEVAVFYRTNAQSRAIEQALADRGLPYKVIGGTRFFDRREIRDAIGYLRLVENPSDEVSLRRVINVPRRGIGQTTVARVAAHAAAIGASFAEVLAQAPAAGVGPKIARAIEEFRVLLGSLVGLATMSPAEVLRLALERSGYLAELEAQTNLPGAGGIEAEGRLENLAELVTMAQGHEDLESFLAATALVAATDDLEEGDGRVSLMTLHAAKGLEFRAVFLTGMEEGIFPHDRALAEPDDLEEERRLCYVGITRARERLYLTHTWVRTLFGQTRDSLQSRFVKEIPAELVRDLSDPYALRSNLRSGADRPAFAESALRPRHGPVPSTGAEGLGLAPGDAVVHARWGEGKVVAVRGEGERAEATIAFPRQGKKQFLLALTPLKRA